MWCKNNSHVYCHVLWTTAYIVQCIILVNGRYVKRNWETEIISDIPYIYLHITSKKYWLSQSKVIFQNYRQYTLKVLSIFDTWILTCPVDYYNTGNVNVRIHSSVASSARSPYVSRTGVVCVWKPVMVFGLPACPTTSTAYKHLHSWLHYHTRKYMYYNGCKTAPML